MIHDLDDMMRYAHDSYVLWCLCRSIVNHVHVHVHVQDDIRARAISV